MKNTNVIEHVTAKWADLKKWCDKEAQLQAGIRECWPHIARRMAQLRDHYPSDNEFGAQCVRHGIDWNKNDRAAAIWMGQLAPAALEDAMAKCKRRSLQHFRAEVESWGDPYFAPVSSLRKPDEHVDGDAEERQKPTSSAENVEVDDRDQTAENSSAEPASDTSKGNAGEEKPDAILKRRWTHTATRTFLSRLPRKAKRALADLAEQFDLGSSSIIQTFSVRLFVPGVNAGAHGFYPEHSIPRGDPGTSQASRKRIAQMLSDGPDYVRMGKELGVEVAKSEACVQWWHKNVTMARKSQAPEEPVQSLPGATAAVMADYQVEEKSDDPVKVPWPADIGKPIKWCGESIWPPKHEGLYTWEEAWYATCAYKLMDGYMKGEPAGRARWMFGWIGLYTTKYMTRGFARAWKAVARAQECNPGRYGDNELPAASQVNA